MDSSPGKPNDSDDYDEVSVDSDTINRLCADNYRFDLPSFGRKKAESPKKKRPEWVAPKAVVEKTGESEDADRPPPKRSQIPEWLRSASEATSSSGEFRQLCRELIWRVEQRGLDCSFGSLSSAEQAALLEDVYGRMVVDGSAGAFEALVCSQLDAHLSSFVTESRLAAEAAPQGEGDSLVDVIETAASAGILELLRGLPRESAPQALQLLLGRPLPRALRRPLWRRRLENARAADAFDEKRRYGLVGTISPHEGDVVAVCTDILSARGAVGADALASMKTALSSMDAARRADGRGALPEDVYWLALPLLSVLPARDLAAALAAVLDLGLDCAGVAGDAPDDGDGLESAFGAAPSPNASVLEGGAGSAALALRLGVAGPRRRRGTPTDWVPREWIDRARTTLLEGDAGLADALGCGADADGERAAAVLGRGLGRAMRRGLLGVLEARAALFVWDQCVLSAFDLVLPYAAVSLLVVLRDAVLFRLSEAEAPEAPGDVVAGVLSKAGPDVSAGELEKAFRAHALPRIAASARELQGALSAAVPLPSTLLEAALPGAEHVRDHVVEEQPLSLADGAAYVPAGLLAVELRAPGSEAGLTALSLDWCEVCPHADTLPQVVDRLLDAKTNQKALSDAHELWAARTKGSGRSPELDAELRRAVAVACAAAMPGLAALYETLPAAIAADLDRILAACVRLPLPLVEERAAEAADDDASSPPAFDAILGEAAVVVAILLPAAADPAESSLSPGSPAFQAAAILALRAHRGAIWPRERDHLPHLVYTAYNALRVKHDLAVIEAAQHRDMVDAEAAIAAARRAEAKRRAAADRERAEAEAEAKRKMDELSAAERARLATEEKRVAASNGEKRETAAKTALAIAGSAFLVTVEAAKGARDASAAGAKARGDAEATRDRIIADAVHGVQKHVFHKTYDAGDIARLEADPKADKAYHKKFAKFEKAFRKKWAKDPALQAPYVIPDDAALAAVFRSLQPPHWQS